MERDPNHRVEASTMVDTSAKKSSNPNTLFICYSFSRLYYVKINVYPGAFGHFNTTLYEGRSSVTGYRMQGCPGLVGEEQTADFRSVFSRFICIQSSCGN